MSKKEKTTRKKPYRSVLSNALWSLKGMLRYAPWAFVMSVIAVPVSVFISYMNIYLPSLVVREVANGETFRHAAIAVGGAMLLTLLATITKTVTNRVFSGQSEKYTAEIIFRIRKKLFGCFYQTFEKKEVRDLADRASECWHWHNNERKICTLPCETLRLVQYVICYVLFGTMVSIASPYLLPILTVAPLVNIVCVRSCNNWIHNKLKKQTANLNSRITYLKKQTQDFAAAKDIRIYGMGTWFKEMFNTLSRERYKYDKLVIHRKFLAQLADLLVILLRDGAAYALLISMTLRGEITVDMFVLYFSAISSFADVAGSIINSLGEIHKVSLEICDLREYLDLPEEDGTGEADIEKHLMGAPEIEFENVSFRYEGAEKDTIHSLSFKIRAGEKIALVGLNGAGKTTLVKLLCGLCKPTSGDIKINGESIARFHRHDYYKLFSPVFQDIHTGFFTLAETVAAELGDGIDFDRAEYCMRRAGLGAKIDSLPLGIRTPLDKQLHENGIELSGGEAQKLMLARAIFKDAPVLVLDEPTAALDPIAESNIYSEYQRLTAGKTSLFISHRLASTRFCDRILYLEGGEIREIGSHTELIALGGKYSELFEMQSCWYKEEAEGEDAI